MIRKLICVWILTLALCQTAAATALTDTTASVLVKTLYGNVGRISKENNEPVSKWIWKVGCWREERFLIAGKSTVSWDDAFLNAAGVECRDMNVYTPVFTVTIVPPVAKVDTSPKGTVDVSVFPATLTEFESNPLPGFDADFQDKPLIFTSNGLDHWITHVKTYVVTADGKAHITVDLLPSVPDAGTTFIVVIKLPG